jgi:hypothetical protein
LSPLIATVFTDDLCFHELNFINPQDGIAFTYSIQYCDIFDTDTEICEAYLKVDITTEISPPFVYSNQCRNAIIGNFLPLVIYLGLYKTFLYPFLYLWATWNIRDLYSEIKIFGIKVPLSTEKLVLGNIAFLMVNIFEEFSMLLLYGILSLYGAVVLGLSIMVQTLLLQGRIFRYYKLQKGGGILQSQKKQINIICESALSNFHAMIWPGLILVTLIFAIFLFDMAYDEDDKESLGGPLSIMFFAFVFSYAIRLIFLKKKNKLDVELDLKDRRLFGSPALIRSRRCP